MPLNYTLNNDSIKVVHKEYGEGILLDELTYLESTKPFNDKNYQVVIFLIKPKSALSNICLVEKEDLIIAKEQ